MSSLGSVYEIRAAATRLAGVAFRTPLVPFPGADPSLLLKAESLQPTGSFKLRGAYAAISGLPARVRARGVVAHSSGNHAGAVAYAAALLGVPAAAPVLGIESIAWLQGGLPMEYYNALHRTDETRLHVVSR